MKVRLVAMMAIVLLAGAALTEAHHSRAEFDLTKEVTFVGTVKRIAWTNPHTYIHVEVTDGEGRGTEWAVEFGAIGQLLRAGWTPQTLKPGDKVKVVGNPAKDPAGRTFFQRSVFGYTSAGEEVRLPIKAAP